MSTAKNQKSLQPTPLPRGYNAAARKCEAFNNLNPRSTNDFSRVTLAMVAAPIAIVTSYVLYQRGKSDTDS